MRDTEGAVRLRHLAPSAGDRVAVALAASTTTVIAVAVFLFVRRASGAFTSPLPVPALLATAAIIITWAFALREWSGRHVAAIALALAVLVTFALACSSPGGRVVDWLVWPMGIVAVVLYPPIRGNRRVARQNVRPHEIEPSADNSTEVVLQQMARIRTEEGHDAFRGTLMAEFAPDQRQATLNVAFCPPFEHMPQVEANVADDSDAELRPIQVLHNGAQLEVRLPEPAEEKMSVTVELYATDAE